MLNVVDQFANKWGLQFSDKKSQVLVIGERLKERPWYLGSLKLKETNSYCYLGVIITHTLKDSEHIKQHLEKKASRLESHMRYTLAKHMNISRIELADNMWHKAILPSLSHAAPIWFSVPKSSQDKLNSMQYKFAKAAVKIKSSPSASALLAELGWMPLSYALNIKRVSYYKYLLEMSDNRLPKMIYRQLLELDRKNVPLAFNYVSCMRKIFTSTGLDYMFDSAENVCTKSFNKLYTLSYANQFKTDIENMPSLCHFRIVKKDTFISEYLKGKSSFKSIQLKLKARLGVLGIGDDLKRQHRGDGKCNCGNYESLKHLVFYCTNYSLQRKKLFENISKKCDNYVFNDFINDPSSFMYLMLGDEDDHFNVAFSKFLHEAWQIRSDCVNGIS